MENVLVLPTPDRGTAVAALESLDRLAETGAVEVRAAAIAVRRADGGWHFPEETEHVSYRGAVTGGALGALVGLLAGPAGLLLGGAAGLLAGSSAEVNDAEEVESIVQALPRLIPPGTTAVVGDVYEVDRGALDSVLENLGLTGWRMSRAQAEAQLAAAVPPRRPDREEGQV